MAKSLCIFTLSFAFNRQVMLDFLEKIMPDKTEIFLFVPKECKGKYHSKKIKIFESRFSKFFCFLDLRRFCRKNKIERIFTMGALPQEGFIIGLSALFTKTKTFCHLVVNPYTAYKTGFNKPAIKAFLEYLLLHPMMIIIDKFYVAMKGEIYETSKKTFSFLEKKVELLIYPLDTDFFHAKSQKECRKKLSLPPNKKIILYVGRIEYEKGSDIILKLAKLNKDKLFLLVGQLFDKNLENNSQENVKIISPQQREVLLDYYNSADLCVFPTRSDAGPSAARESMACGVQVLLPDIMGPRTICPPGIKTKLNTMEFDKKIKEFFNMPARDRKILSSKLRDFVVKDYSHKNCEGNYIKALLE